MSDVIRAVAQAITDAILAQDMADSHTLGSDLRIEFIDQNDIDMGRVAEAAIAAFAKASTPSATAARTPPA